MARLVEVEKSADMTDLAFTTRVFSITLDIAARVSQLHIQDVTTGLDRLTANFAGTAPPTCSSPACDWFGVLSPCAEHSVARLVLRIHIARSNVRV